MLLKEHSAPPRAPGGPVSSQPGSQCPVTRPEGRKAWGMTSTPNSPALDTPLHDLTPPGRDFTGGTQVLQVPLCSPAWAFLIPPHCPPWDLPSHPGQVSPSWQEEGQKSGGFGTESLPRAPHPRPVTAPSAWEVSSSLLTKLFAWDKWHSFFLLPDSNTTHGALSVFI